MSCIFYLISIFPSYVFYISRQSMFPTIYVYFEKNQNDQQELFFPRTPMATAIGASLETNRRTTSWWWDTSTREGPCSGSGGS